MAVAVDATGTQTKSGAGVTSFDFTTQTVGAGLSNGALFVILQFDANVSALTATWDNGGTSQAMTRVGAGVLNGSLRAEIFFRVAPTAGNKTLRLAWTTAAQVVVQAISFSGVNQSTPTQNSNAATGSAAGGISVVITSAASDMVIASAVTLSAFNATPWTATNATLQTGSYGDNTPANISGGGAWALETSASVTVTTQSSGTATHAIIGVDIVAAAAATFTFFPQSQPDMAFLLRRAEMVGY